MAEAWTDEQLLTMLDLRDGEGRTGQEIATRMRTSRSAVLAAMNRIDKAHDAVGDATVRPEHRDGGMPRGWWKRGRTLGKRS